MRRRTSVLLGALVPVMTVLAGCGGEDADASPGTPPAAADHAATSAEQTAPGQDTGSDSSYLERLTPVAKVRKALDIKVEGKDAWVTVSTESTAASAIIECLQMLPAVESGETLTVIYSDGVEELCEWPEDD